MNFINRIMVNNSNIIFYTTQKKITLRNYDIIKLKDFIKDIIERHKNDVSIESSINVKNKNNNIIGKLILVCSSYYKFIGNRCIANMIYSEDMDNDSLNLIDLDGKKYTVRLSCYDDDMFERLYNILERDIINNIIINN